MVDTHRRRGIERRILTSIFWVGMVPMVLAICFGYIGVRGAVRVDLEDKLSTAARQTAAGLRLAEVERKRPVLLLSKDPSVQEALARDPVSGLPRVATDSSVRASITLRLGTAAQSAEGQPSTITLHDGAGKKVFATRERPLGQFDRSVSLNPDKEAPVFINYNVRGGEYTAEIAAPVRSDAGEFLGWVSEETDITSLLRYTFGVHPITGYGSTDLNKYQLVYTGDNQIMVFSWAEGHEGEGPRLEQVEADRTLAQLFTNPKVPDSGTLRLTRYKPADRKTVILAYQQLFDRTDTFIVAYQAEGLVFYNINRWASLVVLASTFVIGVLCLNAYRNVHNNIVRPVSLLNEGAQIIGQGDLDLKLKIATGDEIEELATSFNKMALALKVKISELGNSEERYRSLVTSMRDGIFQTDPDGRIAFINPAGVDILGFPDARSAIGTRLRDFFDRQNAYASLLREAEKEGFLERSRIWMTRHDGLSICVEISANQLLDDEGRVKGNEGIFRDVTLSVQLEQEARERAERIGAINQIANVINSSLEAGRLYESLVVEVKRLLAFDYAALSILDKAGLRFEQRHLWPHPQRAQSASFPADAASHCASWVAKHRQYLMVDDLTAHETDFAEEFPEGMLSCICVPLYASGRIIGALSLGSDRRAAFGERDAELIEQMAPHVAVAIRNANLLDNLQSSLEEVTRAREELHRANEELKTLDEMKTNLLSNVSHELRTPLVAVMGYTDMIANGKVGPVNDVQRDYLNISLRNIDRLVTLIENLLDFSRLHRGTETLVFDTLDLAECAWSSIQLMQPVAEAREIALVLEAPPEPVLIEGDKGKLGQVFTNLLSNAVKFNHAGGSVTVSLRVRKDTVDVAVVDTGIGIPEEALDKVFTRFYQYDSSSTRKYGGTGIGLSIAQDIARLHGSRITALSEEGKGSTFQFTLSLSDRMRKSGEKTPQAPEQSGTQRLVELVTRDRALLGQVRNFIEPEGMEVISAIGAEQTVALAGKHHPDCILVDGDADSHELPAIMAAIEADAHASLIPLVLLSNDLELHERYRSVTATRLKRGFRKSTLLSGIVAALNPAARRLDTAGSRILCVDDDEEIRTFIARCLEPDGYVVDACSTGEQALALLGRHVFGLVLLDIAMPGMDGWETCRRIKADPAHADVRVYMVTAKPVESSKIGLGGGTPDGYLLKPFRAEDLLELVRGLDYLAPTGENA